MGRSYYAAIFVLLKILLATRAYIGPNIIFFRILLNTITVTRSDMIKIKDPNGVTKSKRLGVQVKKNYS